MTVMASTVDDLRSAALALPDSEERDHFGAPSFRVGGKIFAQAAVREAGTAILKLPRGRQDLLCEVRPETFSPSIWGRIVSCKVALALIAPDELAALTAASWANVAPKRLLAQHPSLSLDR